MEDKEIMLVLLTNNSYLVSEVSEVGAAVPGEPDCKFDNPFLVAEDGTLSRWMEGYSDETTFMISSDKILTLTEPTSGLLEKYKSALQ